MLGELRNMPPLVKKGASFSVAPVLIPFSPNHLRREMWSYISFKPLLIVDPKWIYWSRGNFAGIDPHVDQIAALLFLTRKKQVALLFKPTPILNNEGKLLGILGNLLDEGSVPIVTKIDVNEVGSCFTI